MKILVIAIIIIIILAIVFCIISKRCFNDNDLDMDWNDNYAECHRPYVALKGHCSHTGDKTLVIVNACLTCETVQTICDDCGYVLKTEIDCR